MSRASAISGGVVQIAGVRDQAEADLLVACGVDLIGFPFRLPVHGEDLPESEAAAIVRRLAPPTRAVLITYLDGADEIAELAACLGVAGVQLHGDVAPDEIERLARIAP